MPAKNCAWNEDGDVGATARTASSAAGVVGLLGADFPQRQARPVERRRIAKRRFEKRGLRHRALGEQPLDVVLERVERRVSGGRPGDAARGPPQAAGEPLEDAEELRQLAPLGDLGLQAPGIEADAPRRDGQRRAVDAIGADDDVGGTDQLADLDDRRPAQRPGHRQVELLERAHALRADDRARTARAQAVGQEHRGGFAQPVEARLVARVLERDDEHTRLGGGRPHPGPARRRAARCRTRPERSRSVAVICVMLPQPARRRSRRAPPP